MSIMNYRPQSLQEHNIHLIQENRALREENRRSTETGQKIGREAESCRSR